MAGIYLHIPFCKQACHYCDFHFSTSLKNKRQLIDALQEEMQLQKNYLGTQQVDTIYFGGGTPSMLSANEITELIDAINKSFPITKNPEVTMEANPDDLSLDYLTALSETPINRLSIGVQSFDDSILKWMNRAHNSSQALNCVYQAQQLGFNNISIDLIYGIATQSASHWEEQMKKAVDLNVQHISAYSLTVEPKTALASQINKGTSPPINEELAATHFKQLMRYFPKNGFEHYEISNLAKTGFWSRHNSAYWKGEHYLGLGPSAHSFDGETRQWNISNNSAYLSGLLAKKPSFECESLNLTTKYNEYIMTNLRTSWGIKKSIVLSRFGAVYCDYLSKYSQKWLFSEDLAENGDTITLKSKGKIYADKISSELMFIDQ